MHDYDPTRRDREPEIKTAISFSSSWSLLVPWMMAIEQDGRSDTAIVTADIKRNMKIGRLVWMKGWENKYRMKCLWYVVNIPDCQNDTIAYQEGSIYVSKYHRWTTGSKRVRWRYWSKLAIFLTSNEPHHHQKKVHDPVMGTIASPDSWDHWDNRSDPVVHLT